MHSRKGAQNSCQLYVKASAGSAGLRTVHAKVCTPIKEGFASGISK